MTTTSTSTPATESLESTVPSIETGAQRRTVCGIYRITNVRSGKFYIGSSFQIVKRVRFHWFQLGTSTHSNVHMQRAWNLHGAAAFTFDVIEECARADLLQRELYWMTVLDACTLGYNMQPYPGKGNTGLKYSEEARHRMSVAKSNCSEETRAKLRIASTGKKYPFRPLSEAHKQAVRAHRHTDEAKRRIALAKTGKPRDPATIEKMREAARLRAQRRDGTSGRFLPNAKPRKEESPS